MNSQLKLYQQRVEQQLCTTLDKLAERTPERIQQAMRYATLNPGKRLRPALVYAIGEGFGIELTQLDIAAVAIELIHCYSLVHDDLPAMDDDDLRRGLPTCHKQFDEATAILVGDAQQTLAFECLANTETLDASTKLRLITLLADAAGRNGMIGGQMIDIENEDKPTDLTTLIAMHRMKTGALIEAALLMGAAAHKNFADHQACLRALGQALGLAFQIHDDIIDIESDTATLGKTQGRDQILNKSTFPKLLGLDGAKNLRDDYIQQAHNRHSELPFHSIFLQQLIDYIAQRPY